MTQIEKAEKRMNEILSNRKKEVDARAALVDETLKKAQEAENRTGEALADGDAKKYAAAKQELAEALNEKELHEKRLQMLQNEPLTTEEEYFSYVDAVMQEAAADMEQAKEKAVAIIDQLKPVLSESQAAVRRVNGFLHEWQYTVYKQADKQNMTSKKGYIPIGGDKVFKDTALLRYLESIFDNYYLIELKKGGR